MSDNIITKAISHIHFNITTIFLSIFAAFLFLFYALSSGIKIDSLRIPNVNIEKLYIKWDEKFIISIENIEIFPKEERTKEKIDPKRLLSSITYIYHYFKSIDIKHLHYKHIVASMKYAENEDGFVNIDTKEFHLKSKILINADKLHFHIDSLKYQPLKTNIKGEIVFNKPDNSLRTKLEIAMMNEAFFTLSGYFESGVFHFRSDFHKKIKNSALILSSLGLPKHVKYWTIDAIDAQDIDIKHFEGSIDINNPKSALRNIYASGIVNNLKYTYNPKLAPVATDKTFLEFKNGVLYIRPHNPTTYGFDLEKSYLKIDFTKTNELLTLYLRFHNGKLDDNIIHLLSVYHIKAPIKQISGETYTDLTLEVRLRHLKVSATGTFYVEKGVFHYLGMDINVKNLTLKLKDSHITAKQMDASLYNDQIAAKVDLDLKLGKKTGRIDFFTQKIDLADQNLTLQTKPHIVYNIHKNRSDTVYIPKTSWAFKSIKHIDMQEAIIPFDLETKSLTLPVLKLVVPQKAVALISGDIGFATKKANIDIDILKLDLENIKLAQSDLYLHLYANGDVAHITTQKQTHFFIDNKEAMIDKFDIQIKNDLLSAKNLIVGYGRLFSGNIDLIYNTKKQKGKIVLNTSRFKLDEKTVLFKNDKPIPLRLSLTKGFRLYSNELATALHINDKIFSIKVISLKKLLPYSPFLQKLKIRSGNFELKKRSGQENLALKGVFALDYAFLVHQEKIVNKYKISGTIAKPIRLKINDRIDLTLGENIVVTGENIGINMGELERFLETFSSDEKSSQKRKSKIQIFATLKNGYLYISPSRRVLFDKFDLQVANDETTAQLTHKYGSAGFRYKEKQFYLYGSKFGDTFMDNLFFQSKFKGGELDFNIIGSFEHYKGIIEVTNTKILDYKVLNNIIAFIDTVPSLITFSIPHYTTSGLDVSKAYASFEYKNHLFTFDNIKLDSTQFNIYGKGKASYTENFIDLILTLKTHIAEKASKIPLVGYLVFDGESLSTTLTVKGSLSDPKVSTMIAKDIVVAPLNIIKRTLLLPVKVLGFTKSSSKDKNDSKR